MEPVSKDELTKLEGAELVVYAEHQPEYIPLPVMRSPDGAVYSEWKLTEEELTDLLHRMVDGEDVRVRLHQLTFGGPLQPVRVEIFTVGNQK